METDGQEKLYFIVETKGSNWWDDLRHKEGAKIKCGEKHFAVDMQEERSIGGFAYVPPNPGKQQMGMVERYRFEVSADGETWTPVKEGQFGNIVNDPSKRTVRFDKPVQARYFKLVGVSSAADSKEMGIREIEVLK